MGVELLEIGVKVRKGVIFTIRGCLRLVRNHPFLVGILCFLIFLYRLSPFVFQLLVSASPILVCTAVLLGTLLSFGQPNIPEIDVEEKTTLQAASTKTRVSGETAVVEKNESCYVERFSDRRWDEAEQSTEQLDLSESKIGEVRREDSDDTAPLIEERLRETEVKDGEIWEAIREFGDLGYEQKTEWIEQRLNNGKIMENHFASVAKVNDELLESDDEKSEADSFDSEKVNVDSLDSPPPSPWTRVEEREDKEEEVEEDEEDDDASYSGSGRAESSSPDASMADIMPMLDELHPLLDEEAPQPVHVSRGGSDAESEKSSKSCRSRHESDDETENHDDLDIADDDNEDGEDEEDARGDKEVQAKSAIRWTEEDQKNLMDLGSSEIERNQRLENLILRRRSRKMFADRNLIDLESSDLSFNVAPISTRRKNPFDLPDDYYDNSGLPPIPGSAPSVLLPRRNPFDIPYDSSEEKPDLLGDGFKEEFTSQSREPVFRRHESFNVGPSIFAPKREDVKMRPYFVPERTISEESSSSLFRRQSSELSDSKVSSVPETESVSSVEDLEDRKLSEEDNLPEAEVIARTSEVTEEGPSGDSKLIPQREVDTDEYVHREPEMISKMECVSEHVGHGSQSSEEEDSLELGQVENRDAEVGELESHLKDVEDHYERGSVAQYVEVPGTGYRSNCEAVEQRYTTDSSSSSLSEVSERVFTERKGERLSKLEGRRDNVAEELGISTQTSVESTDLNIMSTFVNDMPHREPVYDTSPRELSKNVASSSITSDVHPEPDLGTLRFIDKRTVSSIERESEGSSQEIETDIPSNIEMLPDTSVAHPLDESRPINAVDIREHENINTDFFGVDQRPITEGSSADTGIAPQMSIPLKSSAQASVEEHLMEQHRWDEVPASSADKNIDTLLKSSEDRNHEQLQEDNYLLLSKDSLLEVNEPPFEDQLRAEHSVSMGENVQSPNSDADVCIETDEKLISTTSAEGSLSLFYDKAILEPNPEHLNEVQAASSPVELFGDGHVTQNLDMPEVQELDHYISSNVNSLSSPEIISVPPSAVETTTSHVDVQKIVEEADEMKEIDDALLSELDNVGDFSIKQFRSGSISEFEKPIASVGEESLSPSHLAETSTMRDVEVDSVEVNKIEDALHSENSKEHIDIYEDDVERISELQTSKTSTVENIEVSKTESNVTDGQDSPYREISGEKTLSKENEAQPGHSLVNHNCENTDSGVTELDMRSVEDVDTVHKIAELTSVETEIMEGGAEVFSQGQVDTDSPSGMPELEASKIEDIDLVFNQISSKEIEKPVFSEPPQAELHNYEDTSSVIRESEVHLIEDADAVPKKAEFTSVETEILVGGGDVSCQSKDDTDTTSGMPDPEASKIEDIDLFFKQISSKEIEKLDALEPPQAELHNYEDTISGILESEVPSVEDVDAVPEKAELTSAEPEIMVGDAEGSGQGQVDTDNNSGMTELEASKIEDRDLAFKQISSEEIKKLVVLEPPQSEPHNYEDTVSKIPESEMRLIEDVVAVPKNAEFTSVETEIIVGSTEASTPGQVDIDTTSVMPKLEASAIDDIDLAFKQMSSKEIEKPVVLEPSQAELVVGESATKNSENGALHGDSSGTVSTHNTSVLEAGPIQDATLDDKQSTDVITGSHRLQDSVDRTLHAIESGETQGASSKLPVSPKDTILPPNQESDGETLKQLKINLDDGSVEDKVEKVGSSEEESGVDESSAFAAEKPEHEIKAPKDVHSPSSVKGKGKISRSSSSSSSSSSESSSSDSDRE